MSEEIAALVISVLALIASIWSVVESRRASNKGIALQERLLRLESGKELERRIAGLQAQVVAFIDIRDGRDRLYFRNEGLATAQEIEVLIDGLPMTKQQLVVRADSQPTTLGPSAEASVGLLQYDGRPAALRVAVHWTDDTGERGHWESDLSLH
jgi:hypothetical protein